MSFRQILPPDPKTSEAAVTLGQFIRDECGRCGVRAYLQFLQELFPSDWTERIANSLETPLPAPHPNDPPPMPPIPPPEPSRGTGKPDMEKMLRLVQLMGSLK